MKLSGVLTDIFETQVKKDDFRKRHFVLTDSSGGSIEELQFELIHDNTNLVTDFSVGDEVTVYFTIKGRRWKDPEGNYKYFTTLRAWKIEEEVSEGGKSGDLKKRKTVDMDK
jgi:hypothetical protein